MNILIVTQHFNISGGSDVMVNLTKNILEKKGHTVFIYAAVPEVDNRIYPTSTHFDNPKVYNIWNFIYCRDAKKKLEKFIKEKSIDLAHLHIFYGTLTSSILAPLYNSSIPIVHHLHEYRSFCSVYTASRSGSTCSSCRKGSYLPGLLYRCNRGSFFRSLLSTIEMYASDLLGGKRLPKMLLAVSNFQRKILVKQGVDNRKILTLYNPISQDFINKVEYKKSVKAGVLFVGRVEDYKGVFDFLELAKRVKDLNFTIIGDGGAFNRVKLEIKNSKLNNVYLLGAKSKREVIEEMEQHKIMVVPSKWNETFGLTAAEGMAAGLPVIVTNMGGLPEVVKHGECGYVVNNGDISDMVSKIKLLNTDKVLYEQFSVNARRRALTEFSEESYYSRLLEIYTQVLAN